MIWLLNFLEYVYTTISRLWDYLTYVFDYINGLVSYVGSCFTFVSGLFTFLPVPVLGFYVLALSLAVVLLIVNR